MAAQLARERMIEASFALFAEHGYEQTTVDDIAERAGVSRMSFFRAFGSKEGVIFPDHEQLLASLQDRFDASSPQVEGEDSAATDIAIVEAARMVLMHYLQEGELARRRYALTRSVPALRDREMAGIRQYEHLFRRFIARSLPVGPESDLDAELLANAVVTAHNAILRRWLRSETSDPLGDFDAAMMRVLARYRAGAAAPLSGLDRLRHQSSSSGGETAVIILRTDKDVDALLPHIQRLLS